MPEYQAVKLIRNGTEYQAAKIIHNGVEYEIKGGGGAKIFGTVDFLIIGGGGGGGDSVGGGGGGGGGFIECTGQHILQNPIQIKVGAGGCGYGGNGGNSSIGTIIAYGGGGGAPSKYTNGGSGGGGACGAGNMAVKGGNGYEGQGYKGFDCIKWGGGGGGGAGADGQNQNGGDGKSSAISGELRWYSGGGGAANCTPGTGGCGGGGNGGTNCMNGEDGKYYGGGGGGSASCRVRSYPGKGCQGVVYIRYKSDGSCGIQNATGGTKYTSGGYTIHEFTSDGQFTIL